MNDDGDESDDGIERIKRNAGRESAEVIVALGKFDAMHRGHKALAAAAATLSKDNTKSTSKKVKQQAVLLSFENMAEVLGWKPKKPVTAKRDRGRVLKEWSEELVALDGVEESDSDCYLHSRTRRSVCVYSRDVSGALRENFERTISALPG